jgi:hypothetical protein
MFLVLTNNIFLVKFYQTFQCSSFVKSQNNFWKPDFLGALITIFFFLQVKIANKLFTFCCFDLQSWKWGYVYFYFNPLIAKFNRFRLYFKLLGVLKVVYWSLDATYQILLNSFGPSPPPLFLQCAKWKYKTY